MSSGEQLRDDAGKLRDEIENVIKALNDHHYRANVAKTASNSASVIGGVLFVAGALAIPTAGVSLAVAGAGAAVAVVGGFASAGTSLTEYIIEKINISDIQTKWEKFLKDFALYYTVKLGSEDPVKDILEIVVKVIEGTVIRVDGYRMIRGKIQRAREQEVLNARRAAVNVDRLAGNAEEAAVNVERLAGNAEEAAVNVERLAGNAEEAAVNVQRAAGNAEEAAVNVERLAGNAEEAAVNVERLAGNAEEAAVNIQRAAGNAEEAAVNIQRAAGNAEEAAVNIQRAVGNAEEAAVNFERVVVNAERAALNVERAVVNAEEVVVNVERVAMNAGVAGEVLAAGRGAGNVVRVGRAALQGMEVVATASFVLNALMLPINVIELVQSASALSSDEASQASTELERMVDFLDRVAKNKLKRG